MSDLIRTKCGLSCGFSQTSIYCFDCPALMCMNCDDINHKRLKHNTILFQNNTLPWNDKCYITGLFTDKNLGNKVYTEVSRQLDEEKKRRHDSEPTCEVSGGGWVCTQCTFVNNKRDIKCSMCCMFKVVENFSGEYASKLEKYTEKINPLFCCLDDIEHAPFENSVKEYTKNNGGRSDFKTWFHGQYLAGKSIELVSEVLYEGGHDVSMNGMSDKYYEYIKKKNQELLRMLPTSAKTPDMERSNELITLEDLNGGIDIPREMSNSREITADQLWKVIIKADKYTEKEIRMLIAELNLPSKDKVDHLRLFVNHRELGPYLKENCPDGTVKIDDVRQSCLDQILIDDAINFLKKECSLCTIDYPMSGMQPLLICDHEFCKSCFGQWLCENITSRYPCKWGCPVCPDDVYERIDKSLHYYNMRQFIRDQRIGDDVLKIFEEKLLNEKLMASPNFHWCANDKCVNGFEAEGENRKVQCPSCNIHMCVECNREWKEQHENKTCEEYELWILKNDPNLAKVLNDIGIECHKCGMRYALAPGGCLHFECRKCGWVFCGGCYREFTSKCQIAGCTLGTAFHAHHPRNCLYYMRDNTPAELENMLRTAEYPRLANKPDKKCPFMIAEEKTLINKPCGDNVHGTTGLCDRHYREYLVQFINRLKIDPASVAKSNELNLMLTQGLKKQLTRLKGENEDAFVVRLRNEVVKSCPMYIPKGLEEGAAKA